MQLMSETLPPGAEELLGDASSPVRPLKRAEFESLDRQGFFDQEHVELLFGLVVPMAQIDPPHAESTRVVAELLRSRLAERAQVRTQLPFAALDDSEPQPDIFVVPQRSYWTEHPSRAYLVVEVARSTVRRDRAKRRIYARADVDEYWIVNQLDACIEVYRGRMGNDWQTVTVHLRGDAVSMVAFPDVVVAVDAVLPPLER